MCVLIWSATKKSEQSMNWTKHSSCDEKKSLFPFPLLRIQGWEMFKILFLLQTLFPFKQKVVFEGDAAG